MDGPSGVLDSSGSVSFRDKDGSSVNGLAGAASFVILQGGLIEERVRDLADGGDCTR